MCRRNYGGGAVAAAFCLGIALSAVFPRAFIVLIAAAVIVLLCTGVCR